MIADEYVVQIVELPGKKKNCDPHLKNLIMCRGRRRVISKNKLRLSSVKFMDKILNRTLSRRDHLQAKSLEVIMETNRPNALVLTQ